MADIATSVLGTIAEFTVVPIGRQFGYLFCYNGNIEKLQREAEKLEAKRMDVEQMVEVANNNCQTIREDVELWLSNVRSEKEKVDTILGDTEKVGKGCLKEWCPNLKSRYWVSRKAAKKSMDLGLLLTQVKDYNEVARPRQPLATVPDQPPNQIGSSSSGGLDSRVSIMRDVMEAVKDNKIRRIGIWGMGGVGKTTMVKEVERMAKLDKSMFDEVVMAVVSKEPVTQKIQEDIAELLHLKFDEQNTTARAHWLRRRLTQKGSNGKPKRILVILDDVWSKLDLEEVGIPYEDSDQNGCKIVLTSRHKNVCDQMKTNKTFFVKVLPEQEAWSLFQEKTNVATDLHGIAEDIVKECGGLPIAIASIANALVGKKEEATWKDVLRQLKNSALEGDCAIAYKTLKVSYDFLETKEIKDFFLLCCLFPEDFNIPIEDLVRYGMGLRYGVGLRLFENIDNLQEARDRAHYLVEKLMDSNLLLGGEREESVKMHDLVRDFALSMTSKGEQVFMVKFGNGLKEWPTKDTYEYYTSISLQCDEMHELPAGLKLLSLKILQLVCFSDRRSSQFPEEFYQGMGKLEVLVLTNMSIPSLPGSLQLLTNLRTLSLYECALSDNISMIGYLEKLEILSFAGSEMEELAEEIGKLSRLRLLDLTDCGNLRRIPPRVLPSLTRLEELYMRGTSFFLWAEEESNTTNASFAELKKLTNLVCLHIQIPLKVPIDLNLEKLEKFNLLIGREYEYGNRFPVFQNNFEVCVDKSVVVAGIMNGLCMRIENLYLEVKDLNNSEDICCGLQSLIIPSSSTHQPAPFGNLRVIQLIGCNKLKSIFSLSIARDLSKLQSVSIRGCQMMEEFFCNGDDKAVGKNIEFPNLKELDLEDLPNLVGFCKAVEKVELPQLESLELKDLPKLTSVYTETDIVASEPHNASPKHPLFNQKDLKNLPVRVGLLKLKRLRVESCDELVSIVNTMGRRDTTTIIFPILESLFLWKLSNLEDICCGLQSFVIPSSSTHQPAPFGNLREIKLWRCNKLKNIFSLSIARGLSKLQSLQLRICQMMEEIFCNGDDKAVGKNIEFPNLKKLELKHLPNLIGFCKAVEKVELPQLESLELEDLPKLTSVYPETNTVASEPHNASPKHPLFNQKVKLSNLEILSVSRMENLLSVFPSNITEGLQNLQSLRVDNCQMMEEIVCNGDDKVVGKNIEFPNLKKLELKHLPNLIGFCKAVEKVELPQLESLALEDLPKLTSVYPQTDTVASEPHNASPKHPLFNQKVTLNNLESLRVLKMENLIEIWPSQFPDDSISKLRRMEVGNCGRLMSVFPSNIIQGLQNLHFLTVEDCDRLENIFSLSIERGLVGVQTLQSLRVDNCQMMEEIFSKDENDAKIEFPNLEKLFLSSLPNLVGFSKSVDEVELPQLKDLVLYGLPKLETKTSDSEHLFNPKVPLTNLVALNMRKMDHPTIVCPSTVIQQLHNVGKLEVGECRSVEVVFDFQGLNINESRELVPLTQLKELIISKLPKLTHVWKKGQHVIQGFQNLTTLEIERCDSLKHLFTPSVAKILVGLKYLTISDCMLFEAIVSKEEGGEEKEDDEEEILFPQLTRLSLSHLPNLLAIAPKPYTLNLSSLIRLIVVDCGKGAEPLNDKLLQLRRFW